MCFNTLLCCRGSAVPRDGCRSGGAGMLPHRCSVGACGCCSRSSSLGVFSLHAVLERPSSCVRGLVAAGSEGGVV